MKKKEKDYSVPAALFALALVCLLLWSGHYTGVWDTKQKYYLVPKPEKVGVTLQADEYCVEWTNVTEWQVFDRKEYCSHWENRWITHWVGDNEFTSWVNPVCESNRPYDIMYNDDVPKCLKAVRVRVS